MNYKLAGICVCILLVAITVPTSGSQDNRTRITPPSSSSELRQAFIFGRYTNLTAQTEYLTVEAVNLWVIYKNPTSFAHFPRGTQVTFEMYTAYGHMFKKIGVLFLHVQLVI